MTLYSPAIPIAFEGLVDSGFLDCFLDSSFISKNKLSFQEIVPLSVALIDSTVNTFVTCVIPLPINFPCGYSCMLEFYITKLEGIYLAVLRFSWLTHYNPAIDWTKKSILFQTPDPSQTDQTPTDHRISNTAPQKTQLVCTENQTLLISVTPPLSLTPEPTNLQAITCKGITQWQPLITLSMSGEGELKKEQWIAQKFQSMLR